LWSGRAAGRSVGLRVRRVLLAWVVLAFVWDSARSRSLAKVETRSSLRAVMCTPKAAAAEQYGSI